VVVAFQHFFFPCLPSYFPLINFAYVLFTANATWVYSMFVLILVHFHHVQRRVARLLILCLFMCLSYQCYLLYSCPVIRPNYFKPAHIASVLLHVFLVITLATPQCGPAMFLSSVSGAR